jgi:hypothetical protein
LLGNLVGDPAHRPGAAGPPHDVRTWNSSAAFVQVKGISVQAARAALRATGKGGAWRGRKLEVPVANAAVCVCQKRVRGLHLVEEQTH